MASLIVVGFEASGTDITFVEEPRETGNDIVVTCSRINCLERGRSKLLPWYEWTASTKMIW